MAPFQKRLPSEPYCFWCECKEKENQKLRDKIKKMTCSYFEHINSLQRKIIELHRLVRRDLYDAIIKKVMTRYLKLF